MPAGNGRDIVSDNSFAGPFGLFRTAPGHDLLQKIISKKRPPRLSKRDGAANKQNYKTGRNHKNGRRGAVYEWQQTEYKNAGRCRKERRQGSCGSPQLLGKASDLAKSRADPLPCLMDHIRCDRCSLCADHRENARSELRVPVVAGAAECPGKRFSVRVGGDVR